MFEEKETYPKNIQEVVNNLRSRYQMLKDKKDSKKIVYDENLVKERKKALKSDKEMSYLEFVANKKKWLKKLYQNINLLEYFLQNICHFYTSL